MRTSVLPKAKRVQGTSETGEEGSSRPMPFTSVGFVGFGVSQVMYPQTYDPLLPSSVFTLQAHVTR